MGETLMIGVYLVTNTVNGNKYVGQSVNISRRIMEHKTPRASLKSKSPLFVEDLKRYGVNCFKFEILQECKKHELRDIEKMWIDCIQPEYNTIGKSLPEKVRLRISATNKRRWSELSEAKKKEIISRLTGPRVGHPVSDETRQKLRECNLGKKRRTYKVRIVETGEVFDDPEMCAKTLGCCYESILNQLSGRTKTTKGYHLERVETSRDECSGVGQR